MKDASEKSIERYLRDEVKKRGGICIKMDPNRTVGILDRLCFLPDAILIVELKTRTGKLRPVQIAMIKRLTDMGHAVHILRTKDEIDSLLKEFSSCITRQNPAPAKTRSHKAA